jgi:hypothetical protein
MIGAIPFSTASAENRYFGVRINRFLYCRNRMHPFL